MTTPAAYIADVYARGVARTVTWRVLVGPDDRSTGWVVLNEVSALAYNFSVGKVPTATVISEDLGAVLLSWANFFKRIEIRIGFNGVEVPVFTGKIMDTTTTAASITLQCQGSAWPLDNHFHKVIYTFAGVTAEQSLNDIFNAALIGEFDVQVPAWTIGANVAQTIEFSTYGEAIRKVGEVDGNEWFETPTGQILVRQKYVLDMLTGAEAARTYFSFGVDGTAEVLPGVLTGRGHLRTWSDVPAARSVKNRCVVKGATQTTTAGDGSSTSVDIGGEHSEPSAWVIYPDGSQAYNDELFNNELIDDPTKAAEVAQRIVFFKNGNPHAITATVDGDPLLALFQNIRLEDPRQNYGRTAALMGYSGSLSGGDYSCSLTMQWIDNADGATIVPIPTFSHAAYRLFVDGENHTYFMLDATPSYSPSGRPLTYTWNDDLGLLVSDTRPITMVDLDESIVSSEWNITLAVDDGLTTETIVIKFEIDSTMGNVVKIFNAQGNSAAVMTMDVAVDTATPGGFVQAVGADNALLAQGSPDEAAFYGFDTGEIGDTVLNIVATFTSPIVDIVADPNTQGMHWALTQDGRVLVSKNNGIDSFDWRMYRDLRDITHTRNITGTKIKVQPFMGIWVFGGDETGPLIMHCPYIDNRWIRVPIAVAVADIIAAGDNLAAVTIADAAIRVKGELVVILDATNVDPGVYFNPDVLGDPVSGWIPATEPTAGVGGAWIEDDYEVGKWAFAYRDTGKLWTIGWDGSALVISDPGTSVPGGVAVDAELIGKVLTRFPGSYILAVQDGDDGMLAFDSTRFDDAPVIIRPATGVTPATAGAVSQAISLTMQLE